MRFRLVPEDLVGQFVRFGVVIDHETLEILGALVHDLTKALKSGEHTGIILPDTLAIGNIRFAQNEDVINVSSEVRRDA